MATCVHPSIVGGVLYPCQKCPNCRKNIRKQMAYRIYMEKCIENPASYFLTLTYNEENIPLFNGRECFSKDHLVKFIHDLRQYFDRKHNSTIRYFFTCEYGEEGFRPHYHAILFVYGLKKRLNNHYFNDYVVSKYWKYGFTKTMSVFPSSVMYCTSYALKDDDLLERDWLGFEVGKPFRLFSLKPGLGLTDKCMEFWNNYIYNDGINIRNRFYLPFNGKKQYSSIPVGVKRKLDPSVKEELTMKNLSFFLSSQGDLYKNLNKYGYSKNYLLRKDVPSEDEEYLSFHSEVVSQFKSADYSIDKKLIDRTKAIRKLNKNRHSL